MRRDVELYAIRRRGFYRRPALAGTDRPYQKRRFLHRLVFRAFMDRMVLQSSRRHDFRLYRADERI